MNMKQIIFSLLLLPAIYSTATAQDRMVLLVQLNTEQSKIGYFLKTGRKADAEKIKRETMKMNKKMISDFTDHFTFCPVYYYVDTNVDLIKSKNFDKILLDAKGMPIANPVAIGSNYLIALYGIDDGTANVTVTKGLVVYTPQFKQIFFLRRFDVEGSAKKYTYTSDFCIEYYPHATMLNHKMGRGTFDN